MTDAKRKSLMHSLGEFVGHIAGAIRRDPTSQRRETSRELRRDVEEVRQPDGVVLRRTTIEEIELPGAFPPPASTDRTRPD